MQTPVRKMKIPAVIVCIVLGLTIGFLTATDTKAEQNSKQTNDTQVASAAETKDAAEAVDQIKKVADRGDAAAQTRLGILYERGIGVVKDTKKSAELYQKAADQRFASAQFLLAGLYEKGDGITKDLNRAIDLYRQAADEGFAPAQFYLGYLYETGDGVVQNPSKAAELYQKAVNQGFATAEFFLGLLYEKGTGVPKNIDKAIKLYQAAAEQGNNSATLYLRSVSSTLKPRPELDDCENKFYEAMSYSSGMNRVHIDPRETVKRLKLLAAQDCPEALAKLALYAEGRDGQLLLPKDIKAAQELANIALAYGLEKRAEDGRTAAEFLFGSFNMLGLGVAKDLKNGFQFCVGAAKAGDPLAQGFLGNYWVDMQNDPTKGIYWYQKSADQGDAWSQFYLGRMYEKGKGVLQDKNKAKQLYIQAADQGLGQARNELKKMKLKSTTETEEKIKAREGGLSEKNVVPRVSRRFAGSWRGVTHTFPWGDIPQTFTIDSTETSVTGLPGGGPGAGQPATASAVRSGNSLIANFGLRGTYTFTPSADGSTMSVRLQAFLNDNTALYHRIGQRKHVRRE